MWELSPIARSYFTHPRHAGYWSPLLPDVVTARAEWPTSGELLQLQILKHAVITDARFLAYGCGWLIACGAWLTEWLVGRTWEEARRFRHSPLVEELLVPPEKLHCAVLAETVLRKALISS